MWQISNKLLALDQWVFYLFFRISMLAVDNVLSKERMKCFYSLWGYHDWDFMCLVQDNCYRQSCREVSM